MINRLVELKGRRTLWHIMKILSCYPVNQCYICYVNLQRYDALRSLMQISLLNYKIYCLYAGIGYFCLHWIVDSCSCRNLILFLIIVCSILNHL
jgi:hypothetical protein